VGGGAKRGKKSRSALTAARESLFCAERSFWGGKGKKAIAAGSLLRGGREKLLAAGGRTICVVARSGRQIALRLSTTSRREEKSSFYGRISISRWLSRATLRRGGGEKKCRNASFSFCRRGGKNGIYCRCPGTHVQKSYPFFWSQGRGGGKPQNFRKFSSRLNEEG